MRITPEQVRVEHDAAIAAMSPAQRRAVDRVSQARRVRALQGLELDVGLGQIFVAEAAARSVIA